MNERIRQPQQTRSLETMIRVLDAFEKLLRTISDIAKESATGVGSIYARFDGKQSILCAIHARARGQTRRYFHALFNPEAKTDESLEVAQLRAGCLAQAKRGARLSGNTKPRLAP